MSKIYIFGDGRYAYQVKEIIREMDRAYEPIIVTKTSQKIVNEGVISENECIGIANESPVVLYAVNGVGYSDMSARQKVQARIKDNNFRLFTVIHPTAFISTDCYVGEGSVVYPKVFIGRRAFLGESVTLNVNSTVCHDARIGNLSFVSPGVTILGDVIVGSRSFIGANATIRNGIRIGEDCVIGMCATCLSDCPDNHTLITTITTSVKSK